MSIRAIIVEDEIPSLERLKTLLRDFPQVEIVGEARDGETAVRVIDEIRPDLVFLDIQLPVQNGFAVLEKVRSRPQVIFVTSYDQYAIQAFDENAVDYLLKPMSKERLARSLDRIAAPSGGVDGPLLERLKKLVFPEYLSRLAVKSGEEILVLPAAKIFYFRADLKYVLAGTYDMEFEYDGTLKELEALLDPAEFLRVGKSHIVALDKIAKISKWFWGDYTLKLADKNSTSIKIGRIYLPALRKAIRF
jgi:DNA-binding LytR/AlgR family response regulator